MQLMLNYPADGNLRRHLRTHTGQKQYICSHCCKAFSKNNQLLSHQMTHIRENRITHRGLPYQCSYKEIINPAIMKGFFYVKDILCAIGRHTLGNTISVQLL
ncbi:unnamed protein product [Meganyctiphanes norvegica]|uniref:C2H2-type domain-containing protein n=1 Tax=Meganyctiphanes norvegica TaxID=48144 RepID=A0AAV2QBS3_MEGNR